METTRTCLVCGQQNGLYATECTQCGAPLRLGKTMQLSEAEADVVFHNYVNHEIRLSRGKMAFYFVGKERPHILDIYEPTVLGRGDADEGAMLDLNQVNAALLGVSRRHAVITAQDGGYTIDDLDSTNGTWINENALTPRQPRKLHSGDQIRLGQLIFFVQFSTE